MPCRIVTHQRPDPDALVATYLAERFLFGGVAAVVFVSRSLPRWVEETTGGTVCVVDVGNVHDPARLRFDHKPPAFADRNGTCATRLIWEYLGGPGFPVDGFASLVDAVHEGDHNPPRRGAAIEASRRNGLHAFCKIARAAALTDAAYYVAVRDWLDEVYGLKQIGGVAISTPHS